MRVLTFEEMFETKGPCWVGYKQVGTKVKRGKRVPNCVPVKEAEDLKGPIPEGWTESDSSLYKKFIFEDFDQAFSFMEEVAEVAKRMNHHPKWTNIYKTVECWLRTHDAGDVITERDRQLALEMDKIASSLKEVIDESDPKVGTGKKPEGSGRRLYTDENPDDTVSVRFRTKEDIVHTINKEEFKAKPHKRQSQIVNLIHQRVRAAYQNAKDPDTKSRLKRAYDYAREAKARFKRKTQNRA